MAIKCDEIGRTIDSRITNSDGVSMSCGHSYYVYGNTNDFIGSYLTSKHRSNCVLVAGTGSNMQRDYSYSVARDSNNLLPVEQLAKQAVENTVSRLGAKSITTRKAGVVFHSNIASSLFSNVFSAISGHRQYKKATYLQDALGQIIFPSWMNITEKPHLLQGLGSTPFDGEGVLTYDKTFIENGKITSYVLDSYSARRLKLKTTANASGLSNLTIESNLDGGLQNLLKQMKTGLLVTELLGHGVNLVNGDFSQGAVGFWVENGEIAYPVEEVTIAGNLKQMCLDIIAVSDDVDIRKNILTGSMYIKNMTIAGD